MERHLIEKAYTCAKAHFKKKYFTFKDLYTLLLKEVPTMKEQAIDLYIEILQDIRFISLGKEKWALRENFTVSEINKITSSMFGLDEYHEDDAEQYMSETEKTELKAKIEKQDDEFMLDDVDNEDDDNIKKPNMRKIGLEEEEEEIEKHVSNRSSSDYDEEDGSDIDDEDDSIEGVEDDEDSSSIDDDEI